jgi:hypothetical protein
MMRDSEKLEYPKTDGADVSKSLGPDVVLPKSHRPIVVISEPKNNIALPLYLRRAILLCKVKMMILAIHFQILAMKAWRLRLRHWPQFLKHRLYATIEGALLAMTCLPSAK